MEMNRRTMLLGLAAPAVVRVTSLMPVRTPKILVRTGIRIPTREEVRKNVVDNIMRDFNVMGYPDSILSSFIETIVSEQMVIYDQLVSVVTRGR